MYRMKIIGTATEMFSEPLYLCRYDLDYADGTGRADLTSTADDAMVFASAGAVLDTWRLTSPSKPVRDDGRPNRPLTAYTIEVERA